jgi:hypothetical protein
MATFAAGNKSEIFSKSHRSHSPTMPCAPAYLSLHIFPPNGLHIPVPSLPPSLKFKRAAEASRASFNAPAAATDYQRGVADPQPYRLATSHPRGYHFIIHALWQFVPKYLLDDCITIMDDDQQPPPAPPEAPDAEKMDQVGILLLRFNSKWLTVYLVDSPSTTREAVRTVDS